MEQIKIKIIVAIDDDGNEEEREVNLDQAIAFLKNQLEGLEQVKRQKKELDLERAEKLMKEAQEAMREVQEKQINPNHPWTTNKPYIFPGNTWDGTTANPGDITWGGTTTSTTGPNITYTNGSFTCSADNNTFTFTEN